MSATRTVIDVANDGESRTIGTDGEAKAPDPFDPASLRLSQDFAAIVGGGKALLTIPVKKPVNTWWIRTHPKLRLDTAVIELKEDSEVYLLDRQLTSAVMGEPTLRLVTLYVGITTTGNVFLWPIPLPPSDRADNEWHRSAREIAALAADQWVRVTSNRSLGAYEANTATVAHPEPNWPDKSFRDLLAIAFRDRRIDTLDHPVLKRLRGEV